MERKKRKMLLTILAIILILSTDFFALASGINTYASEISSETNNENVEISAYFKEGENQVDSIEKSLKDKDVKLYVGIKVKNEGYLKEGTIIELENSNFNIKDEILPSNTYINSIEGNKVNLKQINNGEKVEIELSIEPVISNKITVDFLSKTSTVKVLGTYVYSKSEEGQSVKTDKLVCVNYVPDETIEAELETNIITNKVLSLNGINQRIVQLSIKSRLVNNEYPVKQTTFNASIPNLNEEPLKIETIATNKTTLISSTKEESGEVEVVISNETDTNGQIGWEKNTYDEIVVTYTYPETVDASKIVITTNSKIEVYNSKNTYKATHTATIENQEPNHVIMGKTEIMEEELYKGKIYAQIEEPYNTKTSIIMTKEGIANEIKVNEGADVFGTEDKDIVANTKYVSTEINLEEMLEILGQDGNIEIKNGETTTIITKDTTVNAEGNVVIEYTNSTSELKIKTSKPVKEGILELKHKKTILANNYTKGQLQAVNTLKTKIAISATLDNTQIVENAMEPSTLELKETVSKAELTIENNKKQLSTTEPNELTLGITLVTNGTQYDLYKNPKIELKFPETVANVEVVSTPSKQNADEFTLNVEKYNKSNKILRINLQGKQNKYTESELLQAYIQLNLKVTLDPLAISQTDKILMTYTNENVTQYEDGAIYGQSEEYVEISAPNQLIKRYNINSNENTSLTETILHQVKENQNDKVIDFEISLTNNKDSDISDLKILGKLPTTGNKISNQEYNTFETELKGISAENANVYYTENTNPKSTDTEDAENGWTKDIASLNNAKLYLILVDKLERGTTYTANLSVEQSSTEENGLSYSQYGVIYDTATENEVKEFSRKIGLASSVAASIKTELIAQVGQDILKDGDMVSEGEIIKYTVTVKNNGTDTLENVQVKLDVPEGTTYLKPVPRIKLDNEIMDPADEKYLNMCYEEIKESEQLKELTDIIIPKLSTNEPYIIQYEVRIGKDTGNTEILNKPTIIYDGTEIQNVELNNKIKEANIRVTIKGNPYEDPELISGGHVFYRVYVENISDSIIKDLSLQIKANGINDMTIETNGEKLEDIEQIKISEIKPQSNETNETIKFIISGKVDKKTDKTSMLAILKDTENNVYRSNYIEENVPYADATVNMTSTQNLKQIKEGDIVEYNITAKNTGEAKINIRIYDKIDEYLQIESIYVNEEIWAQRTEEEIAYNDIEYGKKFEPGEELQLKIRTSVKFIPKEFHGEVITNRAKIMLQNDEEIYSEIATHVLKANTLQNENLGNIISGYAWLDENVDGKRDGNENALPEIVVKLYDLSTKSYVRDEENNDIYVRTNDDGRYTFTNIKNGSYLVIFEYDTEKYVLTTPLSENVDSSLNSKASIKKIIGDTYIIRVAGIEINNLKQDMLEMNIGLKENVGDTPIEEQPGREEISTDPSNPDNPDNPNNPDNPDNPDNPNNPNNPDNPDNPDNPTQPEKPIETKKISGVAWLDKNMNGKRDNDEKYLQGVKVKLYKLSINNYLRDENGKIIEAVTNADGMYEFTNVEKGLYLVIFEYDMENYKLTTQNPNILIKKVNIEGREITVAVTNAINLQNNMTNVNIGLMENLKFDLELNKNISRIVVQTSKGTKTYDYDGKTLGKVEIHRKQIQGANVVLEYTITVKNTGEIAGYVSNIVDYLPSGLTFSSELNSDWYLSGNYLYTKSLANTQINPGEEKAVKLILTKTMTSNNVGLINNRAEIYQDYNKYGESDIDSTPNNQVQSEDDFGTTDIIIQIATGGSTTAYIILLIINMILIYVAIRIMIKNDIIKIKTKDKERR